MLSAVEENVTLYPEESKSNHVQDKVMLYI